MINEFKLFKPKDRAIKMNKIKRLFSQFGLLCFYVDDYTGFLTRKPHDIRFERVYYEPKIVMVRVLLGRKTAKS